MDGNCQSFIVAYDIGYWIRYKLVTTSQWENSSVQYPMYKQQGTLTRIGHHSLGYLKLAPSDFQALKNGPRKLKILGH